MDRSSQAQTARARAANAILLDVLEHPREDWGHLVDSHCGADGELRALVSRLLERDETVEGFLERPAVVVADLRETGAEPVASRLVGPFRILHPLGEGGVGAVFLARREGADYEQRVALKLLRPDRGGEAVLRSLRTERRVLAGLEHPNIARLIEADATEDGVTYIALELVEGEPITEYCDRRRLGVRERIELFRAVCAAVHYAHRNLVLHRDLKPSNILVTRDGLPKLLDFGIAKLMEEADAGAEATYTVGRMLTPSYASPEHIAGRPLSTASDVYSLGVVLYRLLTGHLPRDLKGLAPQQMVERLSDGPPPLPSVVVRAPGEGALAAAGEPLAIAERRGTDPGGLSRELTGDLDVILTKALRCEADERYASAEELERDLGRYLAGLPILARSPSPVYRAAKFVRRHRLPVALSLVVVLLASSLGVGALVQARRLSRERAIAQTERSRAEDVTRLFVEALEAADPSRSLGERVTVRDMLDRAAERLASAHDTDPQVRSTMLHTIGTVYTGLGLYDEAVRHLEEALELRRATSDLPAVGETLHRLGMAHLGAGTLERAEQLLREAFALRRETLGADSLDTLSSLSQLVAAHRAAGSYETAEEEARLVLTRLERLVGPRHLLVASAVNDLAGVLEDRGDYEGAEQLFRRALALHRELQGEASLDFAVTKSNLAWLLKLVGRLGEAHAESARAVELLRQILGERHPDVATAMNNLALILLERGELVEAEELLRRSLALRREALGEDHPLVAAGLDNLAWALLQGRGDYAAAEDLVREALEVRRRAFGPRHPAVATSLNNLAALVLDRADGRAAEPLMRQAVELRRDLFGPEHPLVAAALANQAWVHLEQGDFETAEEVMREALAMRRRLFGEEHGDVAASLSDLAFLNERRGDVVEAEGLYRRALGMQRRLIGGDQPQVAHTAVRFARLLATRGALDEAERMARDAARIYAASLAEGHWRRADAEGVLGGILLARGRLSEAEGLLLEAYRSLDATRGPLVYESRWLAARLEELYARRSRSAEAKRFGALARVPRGSSR